MFTFSHRITSEEKLHSSSTTPVFRGLPPLFILFYFIKLLSLAYTRRLLVQTATGRNLTPFCLSFFLSTFLPPVCPARLVHFSPVAVETQTQLSPLLDSRSHLHRQPGQRVVPLQVPVTAATGQSYRPTPLCRHSQILNWTSNVFLF